MQTQIGLPEPLQAYKSQHSACGSRYGVNRAVNDTLLTSGPFRKPFCCEYFVHKGACWLGFHPSRGKYVY